MNAFRKKYEVITEITFERKDDAQERKKRLDEILTQVDRQVAAAMEACTTNGMDWAAEKNDEGDEPEEADEEEQGSALPAEKVQGWEGRKAKYVSYVRKADKAWAKAEKHRNKAEKLKRSRGDKQDIEYEVSQQEWYADKHEKYVAKLKKANENEAKKAKKAEDGHYKTAPFFESYLQYKNAKAEYTEALLEAVDLMKKARGADLGFDDAFFDFHNVQIRD